MTVKSLNKTASLYMVCVDYHSGQSSRGYRLLCKLAARLQRGAKKMQGRSTGLIAHTYVKPALYKQYAKQFGDKL